MGVRTEQAIMRVRLLDPYRESDPAFLTPRWAEIDVGLSPMFSYSFLAYVNETGNIPKQFRYVNRWTDDSKIPDRDGNTMWDRLDSMRVSLGLTKEEFERGFKCRALRAYPSLIREVPLLAMVQDELEVRGLIHLRAVHTLYWDTKGYDVVILGPDGKPLLGVKSCSDTDAAKRWLKKKETCRNQIPMEFIAVVAGEEHGEVVNNYWLHCYSDAEAIVNKVEEINNGKEFHPTTAYSR